MTTSTDRSSSSSLSSAQVDGPAATVSTNQVANSTGYQDKSTVTDIMPTAANSSRLLPMNQTSASSGQIVSPLSSGSSIASNSSQSSFQAIVTGNSTYNISSLSSGPSSGVAKLNASASAKWNSGNSSTYPMPSVEPLSTVSTALNSSHTSGMFSNATFPNGTTATPSPSKVVAEAAFKVAAAASSSPTNTPKAKKVFAHYLLGTITQEHAQKDIDDAIAMGVL